MSPPTGATLTATSTGNWNGGPERDRLMLANPDVQRVIAYADPTGETAVANVMRERR